MDFKNRTWFPLVFSKEKFFIIINEIKTRGKMTHKIEINPNIHFGKPCVAGTRIPVLNVLELVRDGLSFEKNNERLLPGSSNCRQKACINT